MILFVQRTRSVVQCPIHRRSKDQFICASVLWGQGARNKKKQAPERSVRGRSQLSPSRTGALACVTWFVLLGFSHKRFTGNSNKVLGPW